ncbi:MAG: hypothetical protein IKL25_04355 [Clostridia bacterium]|nr:hypothetical protein [Clostridia bacterium]
MQALEIYQQDRTDRAQGDPLPRQQYYTALRDALHRELMHRGYSDLLEQLLLDIRSGLMEKIYVVDYAALMECHSMIVLGRDMRDATEFVPHLHLRGEKASWADLEGPGSFLMTVKGDIVEKLKQLRAVSRQLVDARDDTVIPQADDAAQREIEQVHTLNKMLDERCKSLQQERDEAVQRLRMLEEGIITEQVRYAIEARRLQEEEALRQTYETQREAAKAAFREQFLEELEAARLVREENERTLEAMRETAAADYAAARTSLAGDLRQLTALLETKINAWDNTLDRAECRMLAQSYAALHTLCGAFLDKLALDAASTGADSAVLAGIAEGQRQLRDRVRQLETAINRLGLTILRPAAGEAFNGAYHVAVGVSAGAVGDTIIARCITPGVTVPGAGEALLKAEVELQ